MNEPVLISACLVGVKSRYDGKDALNKKLLATLDGCVIIPVCPEQLGGLPTPRARAEISPTDVTQPEKKTSGAPLEGSAVLDGIAIVTDEFGTDVTRAYIKGARETLAIARVTGAKRALLKERSPSCGVTFIMKDNLQVHGRGVSAALLAREGIEVSGIE